MITETRLFGIPLAELPTYQAAPAVGNRPVEQLDHINIPLLDEMIKFIEEHPKTWNQGSWFLQVDTSTGQSKYISKLETVEEINSCGTSFCLAGHVALHEGFPAPPLSNSKEWERSVEGQIYPEAVNEFARKRLGLSDDQANELFAAENELIDLKRMAFLLKIDPEARDYELDNVRGMTDEQFEHLVSAYIPRSEYF